MGHKDLEQVICDFIELVNLLDMCPHDCLLFLEHSNRSVNFDIHFVSASTSVISVDDVLTDIGSSSER